MRRADRLFDIIQRLRTARGPMTAAALAEELEVTVRTVYRDVATLQARRVPIEGAAGIGYMLRRGFDLPPLMFTIEEIEAIAVGARLVSRTGDPGLQDAAASVLSKVTVVLPERLREQLAAAPFFVSASGAPVPERVDLAGVRAGDPRRTEAADCLCGREGHALGAGRSGRSRSPITCRRRWSARGANCGKTIAISAPIGSPR